MMFKKIKELMSQRKKNLRYDFDSNKKSECARCEKHVNDCLFDYVQKKSRKIMRFDFE